MATTALRSRDLRHKGTEKWQAEYVDITLKKARAPGNTTVAEGHGTRSTAKTRVPVIGRPNRN